MNAVEFGDPRLPLRFWKKVTPDEAGCWIWTGSMDRHGYGQASRIGQTPTRAYRFAYESLVGPVSPGLELDHLCRARACVNPTHLEPVTHRDNLLRGQSPAAKNAIKTHCPVGHEYSEANTYLNGSKRFCRACWPLKWARRSAKKAALAARPWTLVVL